jgi:CRISPR-associated protein Cas1
MNQRVIADLAALPRVADSWTFLYTEKVRIERADYAIELRDKTGRVHVPVASLSALLLGPGATITHAAVLALAESGCSVIWCGEDACRFYACGLGETRRAHHLEAQASAWASKQKHLEVVRRMYSLRFPEGLPEALTIEQIRGHEGVRVRDAYARLSQETGIAWSRRSYKPGEWSAADPVNRALSAANAALYGVVHAAIVATGFAPGLGFLHVGKQLSFVYDIADLYKVEMTVPAAFRAVKGVSSGVESRARQLARDLFHEQKLLERLVPDIQRVLGLAPQKARLVHHRGEQTSEGEEPADLAGELWNADGSRSAGGQNYANEGQLSLRLGPSVTKTEGRPEPVRGDAYEEDLEWPAASGTDDEDPF